jgi:hypothetical protein
MNREQKAKAASGKSVSFYNQPNPIFGRTDAAGFPLLVLEYHLAYIIITFIELPNGMPPGFERAWTPLLLAVAVKTRLTHRKKPGLMGSY